MAWYSAGTIQVAANGTVATGTGTAFLANVRIGDGITIAGSAAQHEIIGVASDTSLSFLPPYAGAAGAGKAYRVAPMLGYDKDLSDAINAIRLQLGDFANSPNLNALDQAVGAANKGLMFAGPGALGTFDLPESSRALIAAGLGTASTLSATDVATVAGNNTFTGTNTFNANTLRLRGSGVGANNVTFIQFQDSTGVNIGAVGDGSSGNSEISLVAYSGGVLISTPSGSYARLFTPPLAGDDSNNIATTSWSRTMVGSYGLGASRARNTVEQLDAPRGSEFFSNSSGVHPFGQSGALVGTHICYASLNYAFQLASGVSNASINRVFARNMIANVWQTPYELITTQNSHNIAFTQGALAPSTNNTILCGVAARRWNTIYAGTGTINTSDAREKTPVRALSTSELAAAQALNEIGAYQWLAEIERKGEGARTHIGMTVQRAIEILEDHDLDPFNYGFICYDSWEQETVEHEPEYEQIEVAAVLDEDGNEIEPTRFKQGELIREAWTETTQEAGDRYSFRMDELYAFIAAGANQRANALESRMAAIEAAVAAL